MRCLAKENWIIWNGLVFGLNIFWFIFVLNGFFFGARLVSLHMP